MTYTLNWLGTDGINRSRKFKLKKDAELQASFYKSCGCRAITISWKGKRQ